MIPTRTRARRSADLGLAVLFLALIGLPVTRNLFGPKSAAEGSENRRLAVLPKLQWKGSVLRPFPAHFEAYYNDRFGFRDVLIRWLTRAEVQWLKVSSSPKVILGKKGWLFYAELPPGQASRATRPLTTEQLDHWRQLLEARRDWLAQRGIRYLFVIAPDKQTIYPEMLPRSLRGLQSGETRLDQLMTYLQVHSHVPVLDLRAPLHQAKDWDQVYHATDSHWNDRGAYIAYRRIVETLSCSFPGMRSLPRTAFQEVSTSTRSNDCCLMLNLADRLVENHLDLVCRSPRQAHPVEPGLLGQLPPSPFLMVLEQPNSNLPRALVLHDSFGHALIPFLAEHFQRSAFVRQDFPTFDVAWIDREHPDVVIQEIVERKLMFPDLVDPKFLSSGTSAGKEDVLGETPTAWNRWLRGQN